LPQPPPKATTTASTAPTNSEPDRRRTTPVWCDAGPLHRQHLPATSGTTVLPLVGAGLVLALIGWLLVAWSHSVRRYQHALAATASRRRTTG
jgi:hypothetical protein